MSSPTLYVTQTYSRRTEIDGELESAGISTYVSAQGFDIFVGVGDRVLNHGSSRKQRLASKPKRNMNE